MPEERKKSIWEGLGLNPGTRPLPATTPTARLWLLGLALTRYKETRQNSASLSMCLIKFRLAYEM